MYYLRTMFCLSVFMTHVFTSAQIYHRTDTLFIPETTVSPVIDGQANDAAWDLVEWQPIDQIWMPYDNDPDYLGHEAGLRLWDGPDDFTGNFKVVWSSETNLLYFLVEVIDDVFVDGYVYNSSPSAGGGYPNYDIVEVFIDEDRSGGLHVFDGTGSVANDWGSNAENAFAYHLAANAPHNEEVQTGFHALDIAGSSWGNYRIADYASHFPEFALRKDGNLYTWEFSLIVHNDSYNHQNQEASVVKLESAKIMGLSMAYCDNDEPDRSPLRRNHFFGSVDVPLRAYNDHWKDADWFGVAKLVEDPSTSGHAAPVEENMLKAYVMGDQVHAEVQSPFHGHVNTRVINMLGEVIWTNTQSKQDDLLQQHFCLSGLPRGMYLMEVMHGNTLQTVKFIY